MCSLNQAYKIFISTRQNPTIKKSTFYMWNDRFPTSVDLVSAVYIRHLSQSFMPIYLKGRGWVRGQQAHVSFHQDNTTSSLYFSRHSSQRTCFSLGAVLTAVRTEEKRGKGQKTMIINTIITNENRERKDRTRLETKRTTAKKWEMMGFIFTRSRGEMTTSMHIHSTAHF